MTFREIVRFELAYQLRRASTWLLFAGLLVVVFLFTRDNTVGEALREEFFVNSPFSIAKNMTLGSLIWLLIGATVAGDAAARDRATGMHPLTWTAPVSRLQHLGGRYVAAFLLTLLILLAAPLGILLGVYAPGMQPEVVGPFRPGAYVTTWLFIAVPNAFAATALQFAIAARTGRPMTAYLGSLALFFLSWIVAGVVYSLLARPELGRMLDLVGAVNVVQEMSLGWTQAEKRARPFSLEGAFLRNRLLWLGIGSALLALTFARVRLAHPDGGSWWGRWRGRGAQRDGTAPEAVGSPGDPGRSLGSPVRVPRVPRAFGLPAQARQTVAVAWASFRSALATWSGLVSLVLLGLIALAAVLSGTWFNGVPLDVTTARVVDLLTAPVSDETSPWMILPLLLVFYAGELVWRERDAGLGEITDAMPVSGWVPLLGKVAGLGLLIGAWMAVLTGAGVVAQAVRGGEEVELALYLQAMFGLQLPEYLLFAVLALVIHVVVDQKYVGHLAAIGAFAFLAALAGMMGIRHDLLVYAAGPDWSYTEMRGFGSSLAPWLWFRLYWAAWAVLLVVLARLLLVRGRDDGIGARLRAARARLGGPTARAAAPAGVLVVALGGFVFYNTNVIHDYRTAGEVAERAAEYERRYGRYEGAPQPRLVSSELRVEIHPERREVEIGARYRLVNEADVPVDTVHLATVRGVETGEVTFDRAARAVVVDDELGHRIYALERPLAPGDSVGLDVRVRVAPRGFRESGAPPAITGRATSFTNIDFLPLVGFRPDRVLTDPGDRRAHGLPPRPLVPSLHDERARQAHAGRVRLDAVVGTAADQVAVAPGELRRTWEEDGRRYFHWVSEGPVGTEHAFASARYDVREAEWNDVRIRIFHHPDHDGNLDRMVESARAALDYHTEHYGPYPWSHLTIVERPGLGSGMSANASMLLFTEGFAEWTPRDDPLVLDMPFAVVAHEVAHEWWGVQLPYASVEGAPVLSEGLAWYSAGRVVEATYGREHLRRLLRFMRRPFPIPPIRRGHPLLRAQDPWMAYRKGPYVLHALTEYMGEERVNTALRRLLETHRSGAPPLATTLDLYRELQAVTPDSLQPLLRDFFERNTHWELIAHRASARELDTGEWEVTLEVEAEKFVVDSAGVETELPMAEEVEIGVFGPREPGTHALSAPLYLERHRVPSGPHTITVTVPGRPLLAGIDPHHVLDWVENEDDDNVERVRVGGGLP